MCITVCILLYIFPTVPPAPTLAHITTVYNNRELIRITSQINIMVQKALGCIQVITQIVHFTQFVLI